MPDSDWKTNDPSEKQLSYLEKLGYTGEQPKTAGDASDLIDKLVAKKPASPKQVALLEKLGVEASELVGMTQPVASAQIDLLLAKEKAAKDEVDTPHLPVDETDLPPAKAEGAGADDDVPF